MKLACRAFRRAVYLPLAKGANELVLPVSEPGGELGFAGQLD